jgi:hypothetical protein
VAGDGVHYPMLGLWPVLPLSNAIGISTGCIYIRCILTA